MNQAISVLLALAGTLFVAAGAHAQDAPAGDAVAGQKRAQVCIGCHGIVGYQASFPEVHKVPMISGQGAKYIAASLNAYKKGERKHPTMRGISRALSDTEIADLSAYYAQHGASSLKAVADTPAVQPSVQVAALLTRGACVSCHGANFNKPIDGSYPKIAGQHADYLSVALRAYKTEDNPQVGRSNGIMVAQVKQFTVPELKAMAQYIGSLPGDLRTLPQSKFR
ncbi:MAG: cytochrome c4 [Rubrivivax sp.]|nr:cytochrome c4 [Rubrivivax sp.]